MSENRDVTGGQRADARSGLAPPVGGTTESYECDEGVVFYDAENPLAWLQAAEAVVLTDVC